MRIEAVKRDVQSSGTMAVAVATIKATPKIFDMFANDTYANKPLAIMRELVSNAVDAHVAAGLADRPVEVHLPTELDPTCRIRDYGTGMSHVFMMGDPSTNTPSKFMAYTDGSTKDGDDKAIGGFGIGSKSPFSYVDQFTIRSAHEGILSIYTMFKNEEGLPAIGLQAQTTTDEPNGVEVSFPVEDSDMQTFRDAAQKALQYFRPLPLVTNGTIDPPAYTYTGSNWAMRPSAGELGVIMGGNRYPVNQHSLDYNLRTDTKLSGLLNYGLDLTMPIGSCGVAMSREQLSYVPKTSISIKAHLEGIIEDVVKTFANFFDNCPSEWDAMALLLKEVGVSSYSRNPRAQLLLSNARYKGRALETGFRLHHLADHSIWAIQPQSHRRGSLCPLPKWVLLSDVYTITPGSTELVIIDDLPQNSKSKTIRRIRHYVDTNCSQSKMIYVLRGIEGSAFDVRYMLSLMKNPSDVVYTSAMPEPVAAPKQAKATRPRVRMFTFNGNNDAFTKSPIRNLAPGHSKRDAVKEVPYTAQPASGIMVVMDNFDLPKDFHKKMDATLISYSDLVFVNGVDAVKLKGAFKNFEDVFTERLATAQSAYPELPQRLALFNDVNLEGLFRYLRDSLKNIVLTDAQKKRPFGKVKALYDEYIVPLTEKQRALAPFVTSALPKGLNTLDLIQRFNREQEDVKILLSRLDLSDARHVALLAKNL